MALEVMVLAIAASLGVALASHRWLDRRAWPVWTRLDQASTRSVVAMRQSLGRRARLVEVTLDGIEEERRRGDLAEAHTLWQLSVAVLERFTDDLGDRLAQWMENARALAALRPVPLLRLGALRLWRLRRLVATWGVAHLVLVTSGERFALRTRMLRRALGELLEYWRRQAMPAATQPRWRAREDVRRDARTLADAAGDTYEALVASEATSAFTSSTPARPAPRSH